MYKLFLILSLLLASPVSGDEAKQSPLFTQEEKGYAITFPYQWHWQRDFMGLDVFASAPAKDEQVGSLGNISIISSKIEGDLTLETFFSSNLDNLARALRDIKILERGQAFVDGTDARKVIYTHAMGDINLRVIQYFLIKNGHVYIITSTASFEEFPKYADSFETAVRSFKATRS